MQSYLKMAASRRRSLEAPEEHPNKHQIKTEQMRRKLLKSARKIFVENGFEAARLEDIARDAGHTRGAFYAHFASKADLFLALLEQQITLHLSELRVSLNTEPDMTAKLRAFREFYVNRLADPTWSILMLEFKLFAVRHKKIRSRLADAHRKLREGFDLQDLACLMAGKDPDSASSRRTILECLLQSLALQLAYDSTTVSKEEASRALADIFDFVVQV